ncbi:hypothetical protein PIECOFPK_01258 [Mycovorax composti]|jgi:hypothetical protein|uniref:Outer membrane protein beta-barrel domain-containing protein n=2 Tax=Chitinophagaceae TaxID=563835 RepID=A0ABZ2EJN1_9BACT
MYTAQLLYLLRKISLMKKVFLLLTGFCVASLVSQAQTQKGYYLIGGNIASVGGNTNEKSFNLKIEPKAAWFIQDDLAIGGQVSFGLDAGRGRGPAINYFVGPMARYYFGEQQVNTPKQTRLFAEANAGLGGTNGGGRSTNGFEAGLGPGLAFFVNENIALELLAKGNITTGGGTHGVAFKPHLGLGFQIYLPTSKLKDIRDNIKK